MDVPPRGELAPNMAAWRIPYVPGPLTKEELEQYWTQGFVVKHGLLTTAELEPARASIAAMVDAVANDLYAAGKITDLCKDMPFETRLMGIEKQFPSASVLLHKRGVLPTAVAELWSGPTLMACARQLVGPDIAGHPVWNLRTKTPGQEQAVVPWHQDTGYLEPVVVDVHQATAWVPLVPAVAENGCMEVIAYGHRAGKECRHECCVGGTWYVQIADGEIEKIGCDEKRDIVLCECPLGSVLFLNNVIPHRSLPNLSTGIRWSLDLRWQRPDQPNGFHGLKESILLAKADDPSFRPDWAAWAGEDRHVKELAVALENPVIAAEIAKALALDAPMATGMVAAASATASAAEGKDSKEEAAATAPAADPFDTVIAGPWMARWKIVHHNRHVDRFLSDSAGGSSWHSIAGKKALNF